MAKQHHRMGEYSHPSDPHARPTLAFRALTGLFSLLLPVAAYVAIAAAAWEARSMPLTWLDGLPGLGQGFQPSTWLTYGHLYITGVFFVNNLVSRRYGLGHALWHAVLSLGVIVAYVLASMGQIDPRLPPWTGPSPDMVIATAVALLAAHSFGALLFDRTRGVLWWAAPLYSTIGAALVYCAIAYGVLQTGGDAWTSQLAIDLGIKVIAAFALLIPYFLLRPVIRPMQGFGGY
ncbi:MAG TPA: hypothetical protein DCL54_04350 [Alphaproteobacteria bacterium]|nr:hypothetical protein [Alphaproteobacteria bacterium]HAJ45795.1 hypothetical protein [Alphaproteobacteria bacterium]